MSEKASNTSDGLGITESSPRLDAARSAEGGSGVGGRARPKAPELSEDEDDYLAVQQSLRDLKDGRSRAHSPEETAKILRSIRE